MSGRTGEMCILQQELHDLYTFSGGRSGHEVAGNFNVVAHVIAPAELLFYQEL